MTIDKAIKTLQLLTETADPWPSKELKEAAKLGAEGLNLIQDTRVALVIWILGGC